MKRADRAKRLVKVTSGGSASICSVRLRPSVRFFLVSIAPPGSRRARLMARLRNVLLRDALVFLPTVTDRRYRSLKRPLLTAPMLTPASRGLLFKLLEFLFKKGAFRRDVSKPNRFSDVFGGSVEAIPLRLELSEHGMEEMV
jgi:hypothetical protein